jgi:segregation and condensation protein B
MSHKRVIEAALFMTPQPLKLEKLSKISGLGSLGKLREVLAELEKEYEGRGVQVVSTSEGWQMQVAPELMENVAHLTPYSDLSEGCKRTLALVVYKEPMPQSELIKIQGNKAYAYVKKLEKMGLIRTEKKGRTKLLHLTSEFEAYFGEQKEVVKKQLEEQYGKRAEEASKPSEDPVPDVLG